MAIEPITLMNADPVADLVKALGLSDIAASALRSGKCRVHNYSTWVQGEDYVLERVEPGAGFCMTGQGRGVRSGDYIILQQENQVAHYQVEQVEYYSNPAYMWIALLKQI